MKAQLLISVVVALAMPLAAVADELRVSVMTYNVENLFDTTHDAGKEDFAYLPASWKKANAAALTACARIKVERWRDECYHNDWHEALLSEKLTRLANVIEQVANGRGPDILLLQEIENSNAVELLNARLTKAAYRTRVLIEGWDERGIDTAVLSRLPQWDEPRLHAVPYRAKAGDDVGDVSRTRGILEVRLLLPDGQKAAVFALHLPSGGSPGYLRQQAVDYLAVLKAQLPPGVLPIVGGDFNINAAEEAQHGYIAQGLASVWAVSHLVGCQQCRGSYYYRRADQWSFFDILLFDPAMTETKGVGGWLLDTRSIRLATASPYQVSEGNTPARFDATQAVGVSDHWPLVAEIVKKVETAAGHAHSVP